MKIRGHLPYWQAVALPGFVARRGKAGNYNYRRSNRRDRGRLVPKRLGWGTNHVLVSPSFLAVVFKKQEISQKVVTRMQDLASEFSKNFLGVNPRTLTAGGEGRSPPAPNSHASASVLGPKPWSPSTFQRWLCPCTGILKTQFNFLALLWHRV